MRLRDAGVSAARPEHRPAGSAVVELARSGRAGSERALAPRRIGPRPAIRSSPAAACASRRRPPTVAIAPFKRVSRQAKRFAVALFDRALDASQRRRASRRETADHFLQQLAIAAGVRQRRRFVEDPARRCRARVAAADRRRRCAGRRTAPPSRSARSTSIGFDR